MRKDDSSEYGPYGSFLPTDIEAEDIVERKLRQAHMDESHYENSWFFVRWFRVPGYLKKYLHMLAFKATADCFLSRKMLSPDDAPAFSKNQTFSLNTREEIVERSPSTELSEDRVWNAQSAGLCIMLPGLNASPTMFSSLCNSIAEIAPGMDFLTPDLEELHYRDGPSNPSGQDSQDGQDSQEFCVPELQAKKIMETVRRYLTYGSGNPHQIVLIGFSKGTLVQAFLDKFISQEFPMCRVLYLSVAGVYEGTRFVNLLENVRLGEVVGTFDERCDLQYNSDASKKARLCLIDAVNSTHSYYFFASRADEYIWPFTSSLPFIPKVCTHLVFSSQSHNGVFHASKSHIADLIGKFLE